MQKIMFYVELHIFLRMFLKEKIFLENNNE